MLARAATQRTRFQDLRRGSKLVEQLRGPRHVSTQRRWKGSLQAESVRRRDLLQQAAAAALKTRETRRLATAADVNSSPSDSILLENFALSQYPPAHLLLSEHGANGTLNLPQSVPSQWDPESPIIIHEDIIAAPPMLRAGNEIGGEPAELHQNLHACLRVGRLDRAAALLRRLCQLYQPTAPEFLDAHNHYLEANVEQLRLTSPESILTNVDQWYEVEMRKKGVPADSTTFALLLRAAFASLSGAELEQALTRYLGLAEEAGPSVLRSAVCDGRHSDFEWCTLLKLRPDIFEDPPDEYQSLTRPPPAYNDIDALTEIKPTEQKGLGLASVKQSLSMFSGPDPHALPLDVNGTDEEKAKAFGLMRELQLEETAVEAAVQRWKQENEQMLSLGINSSLQSRPVAALLWTWYTSLVPLLKEELMLVRKVFDNGKFTVKEDRFTYGPFLESMTAEKLAATAIVSLTSTAGLSGIGNGMRLSLVVSAIGASIEMESRLLNSQGQGVAARRSRFDRRRQKLAELLKNNNSPKQADHGATEENSIEWWDKAEMRSRWSPTVKTQIGALLLAKIIETAKIPVTRRDPATDKDVTMLQPAFHHTQIYRQGKRQGLLTPNPALVQKLSREPVRGAFAKRLPMVYEPKPWTGMVEGGYYRYPVHVVRAKTGTDDIQRHYVQAAIEKGDMDQAFAGLNVLGKTPWKINRNVYRVMAEVWNKGEPLGEFAPASSDKPLPPEPPSTASVLERKKWHRRMKQIEDERSGHHSLRCYQNFQLEIARAYLNEVFYFPHNLDFRGRAYPIPPYLNHMGADISRGLLIFAEGKELGVVGLRWLKVHLANLYGQDKASLQEREQFTMDHLDDIYDSAVNPLEGRRWWLAAEDPWQCLGACIDLKNAFDCPDPTRYVSHIPVHQDGTCNGLQHYAALGGDVAGARQVNLEPGDRPADIYTTVADAVKADVTRDAAKGVPVALQLEGKITRKVVKQTVMTNVYGVTYMGAREQIRSRLKEVIPDLIDSDEMNFGLLSTYVAKRVFKALSSMFTGATQIQFWLGECAQRIATSLSPEQMAVLEREKNKTVRLVDSKYREGCNRPRGKSGLVGFKTPVIWTTPLRMPVVQPYRTVKSKYVITTLQGIAISQPRPFDPVSRRKQLQAFAPNFIHSLDATHMILSALKCNEMGVTFASVHDSFWTHAADVPTLNRLLRDSFVRMHTDDIMNRLASEFRARYKGYMYRAAIPVNTVAGRKIVALRKSQRRSNNIKIVDITESQIEEILEERERLRLLESDDPELRRRGEAMVTATRIFEEDGCPSDIFSIASGRSASLRTITSEPKLAESQAAEQDSESLDAMSTGASGTDGIDVKETETPDSDSHDAGTEFATTDGSSAQDGVENESNTKTQSLNGDNADTAREAKRKRADRLWVWIPLAFPPLPEKGEFDVSRLRNSLYFFS